MNKKKKCLITGANGLLGAACARRFESAGYEVIPLVRNPKTAAEAYFALGEPFDPKTFAGADAIVHCAYDFNSSKWDELKRVNVDGSIALLKAAHDMGIPKIIFISSVSAYAGCRSMYGRGKLLVEDYVRSIGGISIRPCLIYGHPDKGMFSALEKLTRLPWLPVFSGGGQALHLIHVDDLAAGIEGLASAQGKLDRDLYTFGDPTSVTFKELLRRLGEKKGHHPRFISVPASLALMGLRSLEALGIRLGFKSDSLVGLLYSNPKIEFQPLELRRD